MQRIRIEPRNGWQQAVERLGFGFHTGALPYWDESVYYRFDLAEISAIEKATQDLWELCLLAVQHVVDHDLFHLFKIPAAFVPYIVESWNEDHPSLYGRFDFCYKNGHVKLLEFNADTPTSLFEAGIIQWFWLQDYDPEKDQFNSIHEKLIARWHEIRQQLAGETLYFACLRDSLEDLTNTEYIRDCAMQAGIETKFIFIDDIGWCGDQQGFLDLTKKPIRHLFKLYPWEFMIREKFAQHLLAGRAGPGLLEPAWKMILSNKAILALLWQLYPENPLLLPAYFSPDGLSDYAKKPLLSREGASIELISNNQCLMKTEGVYGDEGFVYQELCPLPSFDDNYPVIGSWIVGGEPAGIGIRESDSLITDNLSRFVPHLIDG